MQLVLASTSKPRQLLLAQLKIPFECIAPDVDETPLPNETPDQLVIRLAKEKAEAKAKLFSHALIIGADQVGVFEGTILCKPLTIERATEQLSLVSGKTVKFLIGLSVVNTETNQCQTRLEEFFVTFRHLSQAMIKNYLEKEPALNCASSFQVEGLGIALIEKMTGKDYTALIGLPLITLTDMLSLEGFNVI